MIVGIPKEIKKHEYRVGLVLAGVQALTEAGHRVLVENNAGAAIGISDADYRQAGAAIMESASEIWAESDMVIKVKEPLPEEFDFMRPGQILYTYLHLAAVPDLAKALMKNKVKAIAYETITDDRGGLPLLKPMSEIAGRMSVQEGAYFLQKEHGGKGVLLGGVPGVRRGRTVVIGAGTAGINATRIAVGMGSEVIVLDTNLDRLEFLDNLFRGEIMTLMSNSQNIQESIYRADLVVGSVLVAGGKAPKLVQRSDLKNMEPGSLLVDIAVDQGGCFETTKPTYHDDPTFVVDGINHYCVANMPGAVAQTSTYALTNYTLKYALELANKGFEKAVRENENLKRGVNVYEGKVAYRQIADDLDLEYEDFKY